MRRIIYLVSLVFVCLFALFACHQNTGQGAVSVHHSLGKSRKITSCKNKLQKAEKNLASAKKDVEISQEKLYREVLDLIKKDVLSFEESVDKIVSDSKKYSQLFQQEISDLFLKEREELIAIMHSENTLLSKEAGDVLDRILRIITKLGTQRPEKTFSYYK